MKIEHIGIAIKDPKFSENLFSRLMGTNPYKKETVYSEGVETIFFGAGEGKIELVSSLTHGSSIEKFIEKKGEGIHHIAFSVENILLEIKRLKAAGFIFINEEPKIGADNKLICFLHPKSTNGVLIELCQDLG